MTTSLMYNPSNEILMNRAQLMQVPTPNGTGRFHKPVPFGEYAEVVANNIGHTGFEITAEEYAVDNNGNKFFGMMEIAPIALEGEYLPAQDFKFNIGLRGSHDQSIPRGMTLGTRVMVCSNLCFHGNMGTVTTKQTTNVWDRLPLMVSNALQRLPEMMEVQQATFDAYKNHEFKNPRHGDAVLVEIYRQGGLTAAQLGTAIQQWDTPAHDEHAQYGWSAWRLLNAATEALKPTGNNVNMDLIRSRSEKTTGFINKVIGLQNAA